MRPTEIVRRGAILVGTLVALAMPLSTAQAEGEENFRSPPVDLMEEGLSGTQRMEVLEIVESFLRSNPRLLYEIMQFGYRSERRMDEMGTTRQAGRDRPELVPDLNLDEAVLRRLYHDPLDPVEGNLSPEAPVMVEFFDYACVFCKAAKPIVARFLAEHPDVRHVYKEYPTLGPDSRFAAAAGLALARQDAAVYQRFHALLMRQRGALDQDSVLAAAEASGGDVDRMLEIMDMPDIGAHIANNLMIAGKLTNGGTPIFVVNSKIIQGVPSVADLEEALATPVPAPDS